MLCVNSGAENRKEAACWALRVLRRVKRNTAHAQFSFSDVVIYAVRGRTALAEIEGEIHTVKTRLFWILNIKKKYFFLNLCVL